MSIEYDSIIAFVTELVGDYTDCAVCAMPYGAMKSYTKPVVAVSAIETDAVSSGAGEYLGIFRDAENGERELYGRYLEVTLGLFICSPDTEQYGAGAVSRVFGQIVSAFSDKRLPLKVRSLKCGETEYDGVTGMYVCRAEAKCRCFMTAEIREDGEFSDYILKGVMIR